MAGEGLRLVGLAALAAGMIAAPALAQTAAPITAQDVVGDWTLSITPEDRPGMSVSIEARDGETDFPLTVTAGPRGRLSCVAREIPSDCRIANGRFTVVMPTRSGGGRMTFTLTDRVRTGFSGTARVSVRLLPIGGHVGAVSMRRVR